MAIKKVSTLKKLIYTQINNAYKNQKDINIVGVKLDPKFMSLYVKLNDTRISEIGVLLADNPTDYEQALVANTITTLNDESNHDLSADDYLKQFGPFIKTIPFDEPSSNEYKNKHITDPDLCTQQIVNVIKNNKFKIADKIDEFKSESSIASVI